MSTLVDMTRTTEHAAAALRAMEASYQAQKAAYEAATYAREELIRAYHADGWTIREIAAEIGVSFQLVGRLVSRKPEAKVVS